MNIRAILNIKNFIARKINLDFYRQFVCLIIIKLFIKSAQICNNNKDRSMSGEIEYITQGYKKFRQKYFDGNNSLFEDLKNGQNPKILVIACSDSRVDPAIILNCKPGDLFVVRNVANLVPPYENDDGHHGTSAALEFAVCDLEVKHIIIFGHSGCGGINALITNPNKIQGRGFISRWMDLAQLAYQKTIENYPNASIDDKVANCAHFALINSLKNLYTFPWIKSKVEAKTLSLHSWFFNIETGIIEEFNPELENFTDLKID
jgi:carbonic anhydrase